MKAKLRLLKAKRYALRCAQESQLSLTQERENLDERAFYWNHLFCEYKRAYVELVAILPDGESLKSSLKKDHKNELIRYNACLAALVGPSSKSEISHNDSIVTTPRAPKAKRSGVTLQMARNTKHEVAITSPREWPLARDESCAVMSVRKRPSGIVSTPVDN